MRLLKMKNNITPTKGKVHVPTPTTIYAMCMQFRILSTHNQNVTDKIVKHIADGGDYKNKDEISCKNI